MEEKWEKKGRSIIKGEKNKKGSVKEGKKERKKERK